MKFNKLNLQWNAQPNAPLPKVSVQGNIVLLEFILNHYIYKQFKEGQKGRIEFVECYMYRLGPVNDEGFSRGQFRYGPKDIPWGEFYELKDSNWRVNFSDDKVIIDQTLEDSKDLKHYIFFFRDETFECIAKSFVFN